MPKLSRRIPAYRRHSGSGQAIVTLDGRRGEVEVTARGLKYRVTIDVGEIAQRPAIVRKSDAAFRKNE